MEKNIQAIFLDLGNTLRILIKDEMHMAQARLKLVELLDTDEDPEEFCQKLDERYKNYRKWAFDNRIEAPESELWTRWLTPDFPPEKIVPQAEELTYQFRQSMGRRVVVDQGREVLEELKRRGYILGIISNVITSKEIPDWLAADGFANYFDSVVLSSIFGRRKPDPAIYYEAARLTGVDPANCVYIGDNPKRDVEGTRQAGFGMVVLMISRDKYQDVIFTDQNRPDLIIHEFCQLLDYFPGPGI
ncbi:MAG: HAD family hydrolase [Chloroflexi bacterium]|nr:MAG: HAD family hydrolase [Chloroflexota bacterium]